MFRQLPFLDVTRGKCNFPSKHHDREDDVECTVWGGNLLKGFVKCFLKVPLACLGSCSTVQHRVELSEDILQHFFNKLPPHNVFLAKNNLSSLWSRGRIFDDIYY